MSDFGTELARLMAARGVGVRELARMVPCNPGHISNLRSGKARPSAELAEALDERLEAGGSLCALVPANERHRSQSTASWDDGAAADEIAALELGRLVEATEVGTDANRRAWRSLPVCRPMGRWLAGMADRCTGLVA
jgi:transcriptional regulator with XRE-family HTH domain